MVRRHEDETQLSGRRRLYAMGDAQSNRRKGGRQEKWKETQPRERWQRGEQDKLKGNIGDQRQRETTDKAPRDQAD